MTEPVFVRPETDWPACPTPDCENGICMWGGLGLCHPCSTTIVGKDEMNRRYIATRISETDIRWNGSSYV